jgi:hypothetical protein
MKIKELYSDLNSPEIKKKRRINLKISFFLLGEIIFISSFLLIQFFIMSEILLGIGFTIIGITVILFFIKELIIKDAINIYKYGIVLNNKAFILYGKEIPITNVSHAEIIAFRGTPGIFLGIIYIVEKKGKKKARAHLLRENNTNDIYTLCDKIRVLKGWSEQKDILTYRWRDWKKSYIKKPNTR